MILLGVDIGTSAVKASAINMSGEILSQGSASYETQYPRTGWAEQSPEDWYEGACRAINSCLVSRKFKGSEIGGIALVGPAHNVALLDNRDRIIRSCIHWSDLRSEPQTKRLNETAGDRIFNASGQTVNPSWTLSQLAWVQESEPENWKRIRKILVTKDYVRYRFTGEYLTDPYDAVGTQLYDLNRGTWSDEMCSLICLDPQLLPVVRSSHGSAGTLSASVATRLGLSPGVPVAVGGGDSAVEAFGAGAMIPGDCVVKLGTSGSVNVVTASPETSRKTLTYPYLIDTLGLTIAVTSNGAAAVRWLRSNVISRNDITFDELVDSAKNVPAGSRGLVFHPYLSGERTPHWDPQLRASFIGLSGSHGLPEMVRAVLEGVAYALRDCMETVKELGFQVKSPILLGGGSRSPFWSSIVASVLDIELRKPQFDDASVGAAKLAGVSVGSYANWTEAARVGAARNDLIVPNPKDIGTYDDYFQVFRDSVRDIGPYYHRLYQLSQTSNLSVEGNSDANSATTTV